MKTNTDSDIVYIATSPRLQRIQFYHALGTLIVPPVLAVLLWLYVGRWPPGIPELLCFVTMYAISGFGVDVGLHRYFTHRSFACPKWFERCLAIAGMMAANGNLLSWVATHRRHHENSDHAGDPHSPCVDGHITPRSLWWSHAGWLFREPLANPLHYAPDIVRDRALSYLSRTYLTWMVAGYLIPFAFGYLIYGDMVGALRCLMWGGPIRMFVQLHVILSINSLCHCLGHRRYETRDESRNNFLLALPSLGESLHNNHHAFPTSAIFGHSWWELDLGGYLVRLLKLTGLVWNVKTHRMGNECGTIDSKRETLEVGGD